MAEVHLVLTETISAKGVNKPIHDRPEEVMRSVLILPRSKASIVAEMPTERATRRRCSQLVALTALGTLAALTSGAMAQQPEVAAPVLSSGLHSAVPAATQAIEKFDRRATAEIVLDVASLPSIDSIGAGSDIRPFLGSGVPEDLTRAALRRAWSTDPAIRDFIGLTENSWDFNAPGGVPEFAALRRGDIRQPLLEETQSLDPEHLAAEPSALGQQPARTGDAAQVK